MIDKLLEWVSSGPDSQDHKNFKIKPFNSIFQDEGLTANGKPRFERCERCSEGYPPPVFPKMEK